MLQLAFRHTLQACVAALLVGFSAQQPEMDAMPKAGKPAPGRGHGPEITLGPGQVSSPCVTVAPAVASTTAPPAPANPCGTVGPTPAASCQGFTCPTGWYKKANAASIKCYVSTGCTEGDTSNCCTKVSTSSRPCTTYTPEVWTTKILFTTVAPTAKPAEKSCSGYPCAPGTRVKAGADQIQCIDTVGCTSMDQDNCCEKAPAVTTTVTTTPQVGTCSGIEEEWTHCNNPPCGICKPINCLLSDWAEWYPMGGCSGLAVRERFVQVPGNECGVRCSGSLSETKVSIDNSTASAKCNAKADCQFGEWGKWYGCAHERDQKYRTRSIVVPATFDGKPCEGAKMETRPCQRNPTIRDCKLTEWHDWTNCSAQCGGGHQTRTRRMYPLAKHGGKPCVGSLNQQRQCNTQTCTDNKDCVLGDWKAWVGCNAQSPEQRYRERDILEPAHGNGAPCNATVKEIQGCGNQTEETCTFSDWAPWHGCSKTCGGGQDFRCRHLRRQADKKCPVKTLVYTVPCKTDPCVEAGSGPVCEFDNWAAWSTCSNECGQGTQERTRKVKGPLSKKAPCLGVMREVKPCTGAKTTCHGVIDCKWQDWGVWGGCTRSCGGGTKRRGRLVGTLPSGGGKLCDPLDKSEVVPCNPQPCGAICINGTWADWDQWSTCNAGQCQTGYRTRDRIIATPANSCGAPASGPSQEYLVCEGPKPKGGQTCDRNCSYGVWTHWSECSCSCYGIKHRSRQIDEYARGPLGAPCAGPMAEKMQCNPGINETTPHECGAHLVSKDCEMAAWTPWDACSATCGGGHQRRSRFVEQLPGKTGLPCKGDLAQIQSCNLQLCPTTQCTDCKWSQWEDWGTCAIGGDQRYRRRHIQELGNYCGKICTPGASTQISNCTSDKVPTMYCSWTEWTSFEPCPRAQTCGPASKRRFRELHHHKHPPKDGTYLMKGARADQCLGEQAETQSCNLKPCNGSCTPQECFFNEWSDWGEATCQGLCERERTIRQMASCGAPPCAGTLLETKVCTPHCNAIQDCLIGDWDQWSANCLGKHSQTYRQRPIIHMPQNGGKTCAGPIRETKPCRDDAPYMDCKLTDWGPWANCERTCGGGWKLRKRHIAQPALGGGIGCNGSTREIASCGTAACPGVKPQDCIWGAWNPWGQCGHDMQEYRSREIATQPAGGGKPCIGKAAEIRDCGKVDCELSQWTTWSKCDKSCDGGQRLRNRQIHRLAMFGGEPCPYPLDTVEVEGCNKEGCNPDADCMVSPWGDWGDCSASCGSGQQDRVRTVQHLRTNDGLGCHDSVAETRNCSMGFCPDLDCIWGQWSDWGECSLTCGSGERSRERKIAAPPKLGGRPCDPLVKKDVQPCPTKSCDAECVDGKWGEWGEWSQCPVTCGGALQFRTRVVAVEPNYCGAGVVGDTQEFVPCGNVSCFPDKDCVFGDWGAWGACSASCDGVMRLERRIVTQGAGKGKFCNGPLKVWAPCNPTQGGVPPKGCEQIVAAKHCKWSDWSAGECSRTCGGGQLTRTRHIETPANRRGDGCKGPVVETLECNRKACDGNGVTDCKWGDWSSWGSCDKCGGQKRRTRHIEIEGRNGGKSCEPGADVETKGCPRHCHGGHFCTWLDWTEWSACSSTCDGGTKSRRRQLQLTLDDKQAPLSYKKIQDKFEEFSQQKQDLESHNQALMMAFGGGCLTFCLIGMALRVGRRVLRDRNPRTQPVNYAALASERPEMEA